MASTVSITKSGETTYTLNVDVIEHSFVRLPTQTGLPGDDTSKEPNVWILDLGICVEQINLSGIIEDSGTPSKYDMETVVRQWWEFGDDPTVLMNLTLKSGQSYYGTIKSATFRQLGAMEDRWDFTIIFLVYQKG